MKKRLGYLLKFYALTVTVFIAAKVVFMLYNRAGQDFGVGDVWEVIRHGLSLDLSTALYFLIVPFLTVAVSVWIQNKALTRILRAYSLFISVAFALAFVADTALYPFWGFKLDASCLQYLESPTEATASVSVLFVIIAIVAFVLTVLIIFWGYKIVQKPLTNPATPKSPVRSGVATLFFLICIPLFVIGIRGGLSESTTNIGQVYYSQNQFLNHSAVNPVFSFLYSLSHTLGDTEQYKFMTDEECEQLTADIYTTESVGGDTLLTTRRPNIVIILLESCGEQFASAMPYLQQLKQEGVYFANCYANSWRTDRGTVCTLSGYPSFPSISVMKMPQKSQSLPGIARTLQQEGYATTYLYGGDINFTNMRSYLVATGWERLISMEDFSAAHRASAKWGVRDDITFKKLAEMVRREKRLRTGEQSTGTTGERFLIGFSTLSSHEPWDVPQSSKLDEVQNAFAYVDHCLQDFIEPLKQSPAWKDLLIVMLADHGIKYRDIDLSKPLQKNHIPMLWVGGAVKKPQRIDKLCNQSDLAATLLGQMGIGHGDFTFSRDVLSTTYRHPTAVHNYSNAQLLIDSTGCILYDFDARQISLATHPTDTARLQRLNKAILQVTIKELKK